MLETPFEAVSLEEVATEDNFDEAAYLAANPDVQAAVVSGEIDSGSTHFSLFGDSERRILRFTERLAGSQKAKLERLKEYLRPELRADWTSGKPNYMSEELAERYTIVDTDNVSSHGYDNRISEFIDSHRRGLILDCGAGRRPIYYSNVVNYEIANYDTTDVLGVAENLPFRDGVFDGAISVAVLEHLKDPFASAAELV